MYGPLQLMYTCGNFMCALKTVHIKVERYIPHWCRTLYSNVSEYHERVLVLGDGRGTSVWSEYIVIHRCNIKEKLKKIQLMVGVHFMGISVLGEELNEILRRGEGMIVWGIVRDRRCR